MLNSKLYLIRTFSALTVAASLAACSSQSSYEVGPQKGGAQTAQNNAIIPNGQQTDNQTPVAANNAAAFDPNQPRQAPVAATSPTPVAAQNSEQSDVCKDDISNIAYRRVGVGAIQFSLALANNGNSVRIFLTEVENVRMNRIVELNADNKNLFELARDLLQGKSKLTDGSYNGTYSTAAVVTFQDEDCCIINVYQPALSNGASLFEGIRDYVLEKTGLNKKAEKPAATVPGDNKNDVVTDSTPKKDASVKTEEPIAPKTDGKKVERKDQDEDNTSDTSGVKVDRKDQDEDNTDTTVTTKKTKAESAVAVEACPNLDLAGTWTQGRTGPQDDEIEAEFKPSKSEGAIKTYEGTKTVGEVKDSIAAILYTESCVMTLTNSNSEIQALQISRITQSGDKLIIEGNVCASFPCQTYKMVDGKPVTFKHTQK